MFEGVEALSKDAIYIIIFLIPGYIGFHTTLMIFSVIFKPFKYRSRSISTLNKFIISILWSALTFAIILNISNLGQLFSSIDVQNMTIAIIISVGIAEAISIGTGLLFLIIFIILTIFDFVFYSNRTQHYLSLVRLRHIWQTHYLDFQKILSDDRYHELYLSALNKNKVTIHLKDNLKITGVVIKEKKKPLNLEQFKIDSDNQIFIISIDDIKYVSIPKK